MIISNFDSNPYLRKSLSDDDDNKTKRLPPYKIQVASELLSENSFSFIIKNIQDHLVIPTNDFNNIYLATLNNYTEFVQQLPSARYPSFKFDKGQLFLALLRASITLEESDNFSCPPLNNANSKTVLEEKRIAIWQYAIFSSALLLDLSQCITSTFINTCNVNGDNQTPWVPLDGSMTENNNSNTHYTFENTQEKYNPIKNKLNIILAKLIIPNFIMAWMYTEQDIFFEWLGILEDEASGSGTLHKLTVVSIRELINEYMGVHLPDHILKLFPKHLKKKTEYHKDSFWKGVEFSLRGHKKSLENTLKKGSDNEFAIEFIKWLKDGIKKETISVNKKDSHIHISPEGAVILTPEIFLDFAKQYPNHVNWHTVLRQFTHLGLTKYINESNIFEARFSNVKHSNIKRALVLEDPKFLFGDDVVPSISPELTMDKLRPIQNSTIFPTPREEVGAYMRRIYNPYPKPD